MIGKEQAEERLMKLKEVQFYKPTAMELHRPVGHLVSRVQRQEDRRYQEKVEVQKVKLKKYLKQLEKYEAELNDNKKIKPKISIGCFPVRRRTRMERYRIKSRR